MMKGQCIPPCFHPETLNAWLGKCSCSKVSTLLWTIICTITAVVKVIWLPGTTDLMLCTVIWLPPSACALSLQGDFRHKSSFVIWGRGDAEGLVLSEGRDMWDWTPRCLTTEWPRFTLRGSAARPKSNYSNLPKVTGFGGKTMCSSVTGVGGRGLVCWVSFFFGFITIMVLLLYSYCMISSERQRLWHISLARRKAAVSFLQSITTHFYDKTLSLQTFCHLYNISFLLLKYVRVFLMEYILKCLEKRFTFLNICKILTCFVFLFVFYFILLWIKKNLLTTLHQVFFAIGGRKTNGEKKSYVSAYQEVLDGRSYIFNLSSGGDPTCERLPIQCL